MKLEIREKACIQSFQANMARGDNVITTIILQFPEMSVEKRAAVFKKYVRGDMIDVSFHLEEEK